MRLTTTLLILAAGIALSFGIWKLSGGTSAFFVLPLVFGLPFVWKRR